MTKQEKISIPVFSLRRGAALFLSLILLVLAKGMFCMPAVLAAAQKPLPDGSAILEKYLAATGGRAAYEKLTNRITEARLELADMGIECKTITYAAKPNKEYFLMDSDAFGKVEHGTDGSVVWYLSDTTGPMIEEGRSRAAALRYSTFNGILSWKTFYKKVQCEGEETLDGRSCYKVVLQPVAGEKEIRYYDKESGLLVKALGTRLSSHMPPMPLEITFEDYKRVDGVLIPHKTTQISEQCGSERKIISKITSIKHNVEIPEDRFVPPAEIQALLKEGLTRKGVPAAGCEKKSSGCEKKSCGGGSPSCEKGGAR